MRALLLLALASCTHDLAIFDRTEVKPARDLDLLFVLDDSSDRPSYDLLASQLDVLRARLEEVDGQLPSLHVGVVTTDLGTRGSRDSIAGPPVGTCRGDGNAARLVTFDAELAGDFLEDLRGGGGERLRNYEPGQLVRELARLTNPDGARTGCEFEQPLEAMRRALDPFTNPGFVRPGAMLSVVFLTGEDDCSFARGALLDPLDGSLGPLSSFRCTEQGVICEPDDLRRPGTRSNCRPRDGSPFMVDVAEYETFLTQLKPDPADVVVSAVAGPRTPFEVRDLGLPVLAPSCQGPAGNATPAVRLGALVDRFGGALVDACTQDSAYQQLTAPILRAQRSCLPNLRRADGEDCLVIERAAGQREVELPRCADGNPSPCWYVVEDTAGCPDGEHLGVAIHRGVTAVRPGARVEATCFVR
jgi:hypothetical protein